MDRREFLGAAAALSATAAYGSTAPLPRRPYKDGIDLSIIASAESWFAAFPGGGLTPRRSRV